MTITQLAEPCYYLADTNGQPHEGCDGEPHFKTAEEAVNAADAIKTDLHVRHNDAPCYLLICECGYLFDEEAWTTHSDSADDALAAARDAGWRINGDQHLCAACAEEHHCAKGDHQWGEPFAVPMIPAAEGMAIWRVCQTCSKHSQEIRRIAAAEVTA